MRLQASYTLQAACATTLAEWPCTAAAFEAMPVTEEGRIGREWILASQILVLPLAFDRLTACERPSLRLRFLHTHCDMSTQQTVFVRPEKSE